MRLLPFPCSSFAPPHSLNENTNHQPSTPPHRKIHAPSPSIRHRAMFSPHVELMRPAPPLELLARCPTTTLDFGEPFGVLDVTDTRSTLPEPSILDAMMLMTILWPRPVVIAYRPNQVPMDRVLALMPEEPWAFMGATLHGPCFMPWREDVVAGGTWAGAVLKPVAEAVKAKFAPLTDPFLMTTCILEGVKFGEEGFRSPAPGVFVAVPVGPPDNREVRLASDPDCGCDWCCTLAAGAFPLQTVAVGGFEVQAVDTRAARMCCRNPAVGDRTAGFLVGPQDAAFIGDVMFGVRVSARSWVGYQLEPGEGAQKGKGAEDEDEDEDQDEKTPLPHDVPVFRTWEAFRKVHLPPCFEVLRECDWALVLPAGPAVTLATALHDRPVFVTRHGILHDRGRILCSPDALEVIQWVMEDWAPDGTVRMVKQGEDEGLREPTSQLICRTP